MNADFGPGSAIKHPFQELDRWLPKALVPPPLEGFQAEMVQASRVLRDEHHLPAARP